MGSLRGSIIATIILYAIPEVLRIVNQNIIQYRMLIYAIILIFLMLWKNAPFFIHMREKIAASGFVQNIKNKFRKKDKTSGGAEA